MPPSVITGDVSLSPAAATYVTGCSLTADSTTAFASSPQVTGRVYASTYAAPTPSKLTTAIGDMEAAFSEAAGRAPDFTERGAGDIGGLTLMPGTYQWSTGLLIPTDVTLSGSATDVWIFQIAENLTVANGTDVLLAGGARARMCCGSNRRDRGPRPKRDDHLAAADLARGARVRCVECDSPSRVGEKSARALSCIRTTRIIWAEPQTRVTLRASGRGADLASRRPRQACRAAMKTLRKLVQSDSNATVRIDVPVSGSLRQFEVVVVWQEVEPELADQWPQGWLEATAGSIDDPTFIRPPQGAPFHQR